MEDKIEFFYYDNGEVRYRKRTSYFPLQYRYIECYSLNSEWHRDDGPAYVVYNRNRIIESEYWLYGKRYEQQWQIDNWVEFCNMKVFE